MNHLSLSQCVLQDKNAKELIHISSAIYQKGNGNMKKKFIGIMSHALIRKKLHYDYPMVA